MEGGRQKVQGRRQKVQGTRQKVEDMYISQVFGCRVRLKNVMKALGIGQKVEGR